MWEKIANWLIDCLVITSQWGGPNSTDVDPLLDRIYYQQNKSSELKNLWREKMSRLRSGTALTIAWTISAEIPVILFSTSPELIISELFQVFAKLEETVYLNSQQNSALLNNLSVLVDDHYNYLTSESRRAKEDDYLENKIDRVTSQEYLNTLWERQLLREEFIKKIRNMNPSTAVKHVWSDSRFRDFFGLWKPSTNEKDSDKNKTSDYYEDLMKAAKAAEKKLYNVNDNKDWEDYHKSENKKGIIKADISKSKSYDIPYDKKILEIDKKGLEISKKYFESFKKGFRPSDDLRNYQKKILEFQEKSKSFVDKSNEYFDIDRELSEDYKNVSEQYKQLSINYLQMTQTQEPSKKEWFFTKIFKRWKKK